MSTIAENLQKLRDVKLALKDSINAKNAGAISDSTPFSAYPESINSIQPDMSDKIISGSLGVNQYFDFPFTLAHAITSVNIPSGTTELGSNCFANCIRLSSFDIPSSVTTFRDYCFRDCWFTSFDIPDSVTSIGMSCFNGCGRLKTINIPIGITSLPIRCFSYCGSLTSINISKNVISIGNYCFDGCSSLQTVTCNAVTPPTLGGNAFSDCTALTTIYVPASSVDAYKSATNWSSYADKIQAIPE